MRSAAILFIALIAAAVLIAGCGEQPRTVGTEDTNVVGDASAAQIEDTFDKGFAEDDVTVTAADTIDPNDLTY